MDVLRYLKNVCLWKKKKHKTIRSLCTQIQMLILPHRIKIPMVLIVVGDMEEGTITEVEEEVGTMDTMDVTMIDTTVISTYQRLRVSAVIRAGIMHLHVLIVC